MSDTNFKPFIKKIGDIPDIFQSQYNILESKYKNLPLLSLGFHSYTKQIREKMDDDQLKERLFYLVVNNFEHKINDYSDDLENISNKYFKLNKEDILSRSFYKLWELIFYFNLIKTDESKFSSSHLAEGDGSFLQAVLQYRNKFSNAKKDKYCVITKNSNNKVDNVISECVNKWKSSIFKHKTNSNDNTLKDETADDGDLMNLKTIKNYVNMVSKEAEMDLVTCDGDFDNNNEHDIYRLLLGEIITAASIQKKGGHLVIKIFDTYTNITLKMICILKSFYENVYICKPLISRNFKIERFLVCKDFKYSKGSKLTEILNKLTKLLEEMNYIENKNNYIFDIITDYKLDDNLINDIVTYNIYLSNRQHIAINNIIEYKNSGNYFGDAYHKYRDMQIEATKWWSDTFYPENTSIGKVNKNMVKIISSSMEDKLLKL